MGHFPEVSRHDHNRAAGGDHGPECSFARTVRWCDGPIRANEYSGSQGVRGQRAPESHTSNRSDAVAERAAARTPCPPGSRATGRGRMAFARTAGLPGWDRRPRRTPGPAEPDGRYGGAKRRRLISTAKFGNGWRLLVG